MTGQDGKDWDYLDDIISLLWLGSLAFGVIVSVIVGAYLIVSGDIGVSGTIPLETLFRTLVAPVFLGMTFLALLDVYGKRRVTTLLDLIRGNNRNGGSGGQND